MQYVMLIEQKLYFAVAKKWKMKNIVITVMLLALFCTSCGFGDCGEEPRMSSMYMSQIQPLSENMSATTMIKTIFL